MRSILTSILLLITLILTAQEQVDTTNNPVPDYDSITLQLYNQQKWDSLQLTGNEAIKTGYDYFNIRMRTGSATFHFENYALAARHLEKAMVLNSRDDYANELLFYAYTFTGRSVQAAHLLNNMSSAKRLALRKKYLNPSFYLEAGPVYNTDKKTSGLNPPSDSILLSEKYTEKNAYYLIAGWKQPIGNFLWLNTAVSHINLSKHRETNIKYVDSLGGDFTVKQTEFYFSPAVALNRRIQLVPAIRIAMTNVAEPFLSNDSITNLYLGSPIGIKYTDLVVGGEIIYARNFWKATAGAWRLSMNDDRSMQLSASIMVLPLGNLNLYSTTYVSYKSDRKSQPIFATQTIGFKTFKKTWIELSATKGNLVNTVEQNAQLLNNQVVKSNYRLASLLIFDLNTQFRLILRYQFMENEAVTYFTESDNAVQSAYSNYYKHIITGGLTWNVR